MVPWMRRRSGMGISGGPDDAGGGRSGRAPEKVDGGGIVALGWIDFSKSERAKVLSVLDLLSQSGTLDELGIAPIRDAFSDLFFPGTSTIQTRAKYFFIVPYALRDLERSAEGNPNRILAQLDNMEQECARIFLRNNREENGVIGKVSLQQGRWVKRTPADIYWAGLRQYGIFTGGRLSLREYVRAMCAMKRQKETVLKLGNRHDSSENADTDDRDAGDHFHMQFWHIPTYSADWKDTLNVDLTREEAVFLRERILRSFPDSMMACILRERMTDVLAAGSFQELHSFLPLFPDRLRDDYNLALSFSDFIFVIRAVYNMIVSGGDNAEANQIWQEAGPSLPDIAAVDLDRIFARLGIPGNEPMKAFLRKSQAWMADGDLEGLKKEIINREVALKGTSRAKTMNPEQFDPQGWYGGGELDYRYRNAKVILTDIFGGESGHAES